MRVELQNLKPIQKSPQELLAEIRQLLSPHNQQQTRRHLTPSQIDDMLKDSYEHSIVLKKAPSLKQATQQKVQEATSILQSAKQPAFVQHYAKQKISSEMFTPLRSQIPEEEQQYYQRQRQELLKQRRQQDQEQLQRERNVIETTKKFVRYESKTLPYADIHLFTQKEGSSSRTYLLNQQPEKSETSVNNQIDESLFSNLQAKFEEMKQTQMKPDPSLQRLNNLGEDDVIEIIDQDQTLNQQEIREETQRNVFEALKNCPRFVRVFRQLLVNQLTLQKLLNDEASSKHRSSLNRSEQAFKYKNQPIAIYKKSEPLGETVASLTKKYKSKGIVLREMGFQSTVKSVKPICQKTISKMVGVSNDYHPKKAILTENQLAWCEEKEEIGPESKRVQLTIQNIRVQKKTKEEGSFFSKKTAEIEVVFIEGSNRSLVFEKNYLQGGELYEDLCNLMAQKVYRLNTIIGCKVNQNMSDFILNKKATVFDISNEFLQSYDKYPTRDYRIMIMNILVSIFPFRSEVTRINCSSCKTNVEQNSILFKGLRFSKLQEIVVSETKFNADCLTTVTGYLSNLGNKLSVTFSNCMIDDAVLMAAREPFSRCTNIQRLNLSLNSFTLQGFSVILEMSTQQRSVLSELNISENMINNLAVIGELIKKCRTLEILIAENCGFSFESQQQLKHFFQNCRNSKVRRLSLLRNQLVNSLKCFQDFWVADTPKEINVDLGIYTEKTSKNLQGKLL